MLQNHVKNLPGQLPCLLLVNGVPNLSLFYAQALCDLRKGEVLDDGRAVDGEELLHLDVLRLPHLRLDGDLAVLSKLQVDLRPALESTLQLANEDEFEQASSLVDDELQMLHALVAGLDLEAEPAELALEIRLREVAGLDRAIFEFERL